MVCAQNTQGLGFGKMLKESSAIDVNEKGSLDSVEISKMLESGIFAIFAQERERAKMYHDVKLSSVNLIWLLNIPIPVEIFTLCADDDDSIDTEEKTTTTIGRCCYIVECELTFPPRTRENSIRFAYSLRCTTKSNPCKTCKTKQKPRNHFMSYSNLLR